MMRFLILGMVLVAMGAFLAVAQETELKKKPLVPEKVDLQDPDDQEPPVKEPDLPAAQPQPGGQKEEDKTAELIARIQGNMEKSGERLEKKDPGPTTRQIQRDIVQDLDELIEQQKKRDQQNQSSSSSQSQSRQSKQQKSQQLKSANKDKTDQKSQPMPQPNPMNAGQKDKKDQLGKDNKNKEDQLGKDNKDKKDQLGKGNKDKKDQLSQGGQGGDSRKKDKNTVADLYRDIWGHLPATKRQEMDAYSRERFMRGYEDLLRQYYRTIAEQGRRQEGD